MNEVVRKKANVSQGRRALMRAGKAMLVLAATLTLLAAMLFAFVPGVAADFNFPGTAVVITTAMAWLLGVILFAIGALGIYGSRGSGDSSGSEIGMALSAIGVVAGFLFIAGAVAYPGAISPVTVAPPPTTTSPLGYTITWTQQTTDVLATPYTAVTSQTPFSSNAAKTVAGYMWAAQASGTGAILTVSGNNAAFVDYAGDQVAVAVGGGKLSANAGTSFQVKGILTYTSGVPGASGGGAVGLPIWAFVQSMTYNVAQGGQAQTISTQTFNNGTVVNTPMWQSIGSSDFPITMKDGAAGQDPVCPNFRNVPTLTAAQAIATGGCAAGVSGAGWDANVARSTGAITFYLTVNLGDAGPFGYSSSGTQDAPVGSSIVFTFAVGIPQSMAYPYNGVGYYTPNLAIVTITLSRSQA